MDTNNTKRIGLVTAVVAMSILSACTTWDRMTGQSPGTTGAATGTTSGMTGTTGAGGAYGGTTSMPGIEVSQMRSPATVPSTARGMPAFRSYAECRSWVDQQGQAMTRGPVGAGGEVTSSDLDPCRNVRYGS